MYVCTMCTSTALVADGVPAQPLIAIVLCTVVLSGIATSVAFVPVQPATLSTVTVSAAERVIDAAVAVTVIGAEPRLAPGAALTVTVVDSPAVIVCGSNVTVTPWGTTPVEKVTSSATPLITVVPTLTVADSPGSRATAAGESASVKSLP